MLVIRTKIGARKWLYRLVFGQYLISFTLLCNVGFGYFPHAFDVVIEWRAQHGGYWRVVDGNQRGDSVGWLQGKDHGSFGAPKVESICFVFCCTLDVKQRSTAYIECPIRTVFPRWCCLMKSDTSSARWVYVCSGACGESPWFRRSCKFVHVNLDATHKRRENSRHTTM